MKDEIKEIIELINTKYEDYYIDDFLSGEDVKMLVDYITNLQEENANQEYTIKTLLKGNVDVCNRNKKAIEYIEDNTHYFSTDTKEIYFSIDTETDEEFCNTLENILIGSDNNE